LPIFRGSKVVFTHHIKEVAGGIVNLALDQLYI
jgi:hypothetical protein